MKSEMWFYSDFTNALCSNNQFKNVSDFIIQTHLKKKNWARENTIGWKK